MMTKTQNSSYWDTGMDPFKLDLQSIDFGAVRSAVRNDRSVAPLHSILEGHRILLVVSASIAAYKTPTLARALRGFGAQVDVCVTARAGQIIGREALAWAVGEEGRVFDGDRLSGRVEHLEGYSLYLVAPATYDFINGIAQGRADTPSLTTMAAAIGRVERGRAKMLIAPCMNGDMSNSILKESILRLLSSGVNFLAPRNEGEKLKLPLAMTTTVGVSRLLSCSPVKGMEILVTGGPTPVEVDRVRRLTNKFTGKLGCEIARELAIRGANPKLLLGGQLPIPKFLEPFTIRHASYSEYRDRVMKIADEDRALGLAVLSAAVADYRPTSVYPGKITSKQSTLRLPDLVPTEKVVDLFHERRSDVPIVSFKLLSGVGENDLVAEAQRRLQTHSDVVVANLEEECLTKHQIVRIVSKDGVQKVEGSKRKVARAIVATIESLVKQRENHV